MNEKEGNLMLDECIIPSEEVIPITKKIRCLQYHNARHFKLYRDKKQINKIYLKNRSDRDNKTYICQDSKKFNAKKSLDKLSLNSVY